jgi:hypothetical protein
MYICSAMTIEERTAANIASYVKECEWLHIFY